MNEVIKTIENRVSLRKYKDKKISSEIENSILNSAMRAPTAGNMMLYSILNIKDEKIKKELSISCDNQPFINNAALVLVFLADMNKWFRFFEVCNVKDYFEKYNLDFKNPDEALFLLSINDALIAAQNSVIAAESLGIGSCYIGDIMEKFEFHKELLNLPPLVFPATMVCFGYYEDDMKLTKRNRFDKEYVVFENGYRDFSDEDIFTMYKNHKDHKNMDDDALKEYALNFYKRKISSEFANEMGRSIRSFMNTMK